MKEVSCKQYHVDILILGQRHDFVKALGAVISPDRVPLVVANMAVRSYQYANGIGICRLLAKFC